MTTTVALVASGCGGSGAKDAPGPGGALTVYVSVPRHGTDAAAGAAVLAGARQALTDANGRAGSRKVRLAALDDSLPAGPTWDPVTVEKNANAAAADRSAIAYIGELDHGGSAVSVPVTNDAGILQVSPGDGLTTLTREQPGAPIGTGPARYYPSGTRNFMRLVPTDGLQAGELVRWAREQGARRLAVVQDDEVFGRALAQQVVTAAERERLPVTGLLEPRDDPAGFPDFARKVAQQRPDAVVYTGLGDATSGQLLAAIEAALPGVRLFGSSALADAEPTPPGLPDVRVLTPLLPPSGYGPRARRLLARIAPRPTGTTGAEALYGYEAMRVVLDAIAAAGDGSPARARVARAALEAGVRRSVIGDYTVLPSGDVAPARFGAYRRSAAGLRFLGTRMARR